MINFFKEHDPFVEAPALRNIVTGMSAPHTCNADDAKTVGDIILNDMVGKDVFNYSFKKANQLRNLDANVINVNGVSVPVNQEKIFQRFITAASNSEIELSEALKYELCPFPPSLFKGKYTMNNPNKPALADALWNLVTEKDDDLENSDDNSAEQNMESEITNDPHNAQYILDGGALLHRIPWSVNITFLAIIELYKRYIYNRYHGRPVVVFDTYTSKPSPKDSAHIARTGGIIGPEVIFNEDTVIICSKSLFLSNPVNKQRFLNMLGRHLENAGCVILYAPIHQPDADVLIVDTALEYVKHGDTVLIGVLIY